MACIINFLQEPYHGCRAGLPQPERWHELVNTDAAVYGGSNVGNVGDVLAGRARRSPPRRSSATIRAYGRSGESSAPRRRSRRGA